MAENGNKAAASWLEPPVEQEGLKRYVETIRERSWMVILAVVITTGAAIAYVVTAQKRYETTADMLVTPASSQDTLLGQLGTIKETADPTRDVETAARLVTSTDVANRVRSELRLSESARDLLSDVNAAPVAQSNIVAVTAQRDTPEEARDVANGFAEETVADRTEQLHVQVDRLLELNAGDVERLRTLRNSPDPTLRVETLADLPEDPASPRPLLSIAGGLLAGLVLGIAAAFGSQVLDPRLRREEQLRRLYRLPILARVPKEPRRNQGMPLSPRRISSSAAEAYRTLRGTLSASRAKAGDPHAVLITGSSPSEGKTTTAINLAASLALAGSHVILIEADLRRPSIGNALDIEAEQGIVSVLLENTDLRDALVTSKAYGPNLGFLLADYEGGWISELFSLPAAHGLVQDAKELADYVVIDSPPLTEVIDALPLTRNVDDVVLVTRLGRSRLDRISRLAELLAENGVKPAGFAVVGTERPSRSNYSYYVGSDGAASTRRRFTSTPAAR